VITVAAALVTRDGIHQDADEFGKRKLVLVALAAVLIEEILKNLVRGQVTPEDVEGFRQRQLGQDANVKRILRRFLWRTQYHERVGTLFPGLLYSTRSAVVQMRKD